MASTIVSSLYNSLFNNFHIKLQCRNNQRCFKDSRSWRIRASSSAAPGVNFSTLESAISKKDSDAVKEVLDQLSEVGWAKKWSSQPYVSRRTTSIRELTALGIKNAENLAIPSVRNDAAFLFTVEGTTGFLGVLTSLLPGWKNFSLWFPLTSRYSLVPHYYHVQLIFSCILRSILFQDWGFFVPYLIGSISLIVLAVGSISPGQPLVDFHHFFPDYQEWIARHEAAHFLVSYLLGLSVLGYSLDIGKEHVNLIDERLEKLIYSGQRDAKDLDSLKLQELSAAALFSL